MSYKINNNTIIDDTSNVYVNIVTSNTVQANVSVNTALLTAQQATITNGIVTNLTAYNTTFQGPIIYSGQSFKVANNVPSWNVASLVANSSFIVNRSYDAWATAQQNQNYANTYVDAAILWNESLKRWRTVDVTLSEPANTTTKTYSTIALNTDKLSSFATTSSAELRSVISDDTGTGSLVFATNPTLDTNLMFSGNDPYIKHTTDNRYLVFSGGSGWNGSAACMVLYGNNAPSFAGGVMFTTLTSNTNSVSAKQVNISGFTGGQYIDGNQILHEGLTSFKTPSSGGNYSFAFSTSPATIFNTQPVVGVHTGTGSFDGFALYRAGNTPWAPSLFFQKTRGSTPSINTALQQWDYTGQIIFGAATGNGTDYRGSAAILAQVSEATSSTNTPGYLSFSTTKSGANSYNTKLSIDSYGSTYFFPGNITGGLFVSCDINANPYISFDSNDFISYDRTNNLYNIYAGGAWSAVIRTGGTASTSASTGALSVNGGVGISGDVYVGSSVRNSGGYYSTTTAALRHIYGNYGILYYQDGSNFYFLVTNSGDQYGSFNGLRPFYWNLSSGAVTIDGTNAGTTIGGLLTLNNGITLNNASSNLIYFNSAGTNPPSYTTRSVGTKIVLFPNLGASSVDFAIGIDSSTLWQSVHNTAGYFKWYAGTTNVATLTGGGEFRTTGGHYINYTGPTIYLQDTDNRSSMIHCNSNTFYILRGSNNNSSLWETFDGVWPLQINLDNNDAYFGGNLYLGRVSYDVALKLSSGNIKNKVISFQTSGSERWILGTNSDSETGSNAGSNLFINRYNDSGALLSTPFSINRSSGLVSINNLSVNSGTNSSSTTTGALTVAGGTGITGSMYLGGILSVKNSSAPAGTGSEIAQFLPSDWTSGGGKPYLCIKTGYSATEMKLMLWDGTSTAGTINLDCSNVSTAGNLIIGGQAYLSDAKFLYLGTGNDLGLIHDGTNSYIQNNTGYLNIVSSYGVIISTTNGSNLELWSSGAYLDSTETYFRSQDGSTYFAKFDSAGLSLLNPTSNLIHFNNVGANPPTVSTRSPGTKIVLYPNVGASSVDYAIGIDNATLWQSIPQNISTNYFKWYGGQTNIATLDGTGNFTTVGSITVLDSKGYYVGTGMDGVFYHDGTNTHIVNNTGAFQIINSTTGGIFFKSNGGGASGSAQLMYQNDTYYDSTTHHFRALNGTSEFAYFNSNGLTTGAHINLTSFDPYIRTDSPLKHIVISGGNGWNTSGACMVVYGADDPNNGGSILCTTATANAQPTFARRFTFQGFTGGIVTDNSINYSTLNSGGAVTGLVITNPIGTHAAGTESRIELVPNAAGTGVRSVQLGAISSGQWSTDFAIRVSPGGSSPTEFFRLKSTGELNLSASISSTSTTTGALTVSGGAGIAENLNVGGRIYPISGFGITTKDDISTRINSGFWQSAVANTATGWPVTTNSWYHLMSATHSNDANYFSMQFAGSFFDSNEIYYRTTNNVGTGGWYKLYHAGNIGTGTNTWSGIQTFNAATIRTPSGGGNYSFGYTNSPATVYGTSPVVGIHTTGYDGLALYRPGADGNGSSLIFQKTYGTNSESSVALPQWTSVGQIIWSAAVGSGAYRAIAQISAYSGPNSTSLTSSPGNIAFATTIEGNTSTTTRMIIGNDGAINFYPGSISGQGNFYISDGGSGNPTITFGANSDRLSYNRAGNYFSFRPIGSEAVKIYTGGTQATSTTTGALVVTGGLGVSGFVTAQYFNCVADTNANMPTHVAVQSYSDNYIRWQTLGDFYTNLTGNYNAIELSSKLTGDRYSYIDFHADDTYTDYSARLIRDPGPNGGYSLYQNGTGQLGIITNNLADIALYTNSTKRMRIDKSSGSIEFYPGTIASSGYFWIDDNSSNGNPTINVDASDYMRYYRASNYFAFSAGGAEALKVYTGGTGSSSTTTGAAVVTGGLGVSGAIYSSVHIASYSSEWPLQSICSASGTTNRGGILQQRTLNGSTITSGTILGGISVGGHKGDAVTSGWNGGGELQFIATENWGTTSCGTKISFKVSQDGTTSPQTPVEIFNYGLSLGDNKGIYFGAGEKFGIYHTATDTAMFNTEGDIYIDNTAGSGKITLAGNLEVLYGGVSFAAISVINAAYALTKYEYTVLADATNGSFTLTLPSAVSNKGRIYIIKRIDNNTGATVTVGRANTQNTIDGVSGGKTMAANSSYMPVMTVQSDGGTGWWITSRYNC